MKHSQPFLRLFQAFSAALRAPCPVFLHEDYYWLDEVSTSAQHVVVPPRTPRLPGSALLQNSFLEAIHYYRSIFSTATMNGSAEGRASHIEANQSARAYRTLHYWVRPSCQVIATVCG